MRSILLVLMVSAACGGSPSSGAFMIDIINPSCTDACTKGASNTATLELTSNALVSLNVRMRASDPSLTFALEGQTLATAQTDAVAVDVPSGQPTQMPVQFACNGAGGTLIASAKSDDEMTDSPPVEIHCPGAALEEENIVGAVSVTLSRAGTETPTKFGGIQLFPASTKADRDAARNEFLKLYRLCPIGACAVLTFGSGPTLVRQDVPAGTSFSKVGGGAPLTFADTTGFVTSTPEAGATYDANVAAAGTFTGVMAPGLSAMPAFATGISAGTLITSGNLMGEASPGHNLGNFTAGATTLPMFSWTMPSPAPTDVVVRIFDPSMSDPGPATLTVCRLMPNATSFAVPASVYSTLTQNTSGQNFDVISMDLNFTNLAVAPVTGAAAVDKFFSSMTIEDKNYFFRKTP